MATPIRIDSPLYSGSQPHRVLVVGGSYGGLTFVSNLLDIVDGKPSRPYHRPIPDFEGRTSERGVEITLLDERDGFFHTVGAPLAHTAKKTVSSFWKEYSALEELQHPKLKIVQGKIENIDCTSQMAKYVDSNSRETVQHGYDYLVMATGLGRQWPIVPESHKKDRYVVDALKHINSLSGSKRMVVIGGGAVGIEIAAEAKYNNPEVDVTLIHSKPQLLSNEPLPEVFKERALAVMEEEGVEVILNQRATVLGPVDIGVQKIQLTDGRTIDAGIVINATSKSTPNTQSLPTEALDEDGYVKVNSCMNLPSTVANSSAHFAIGDICAWSGIKRAGGAMSMGQLVASNIYSHIMEAEDPTWENKQCEFPNVPPMMGLAIGKQAIGYAGPTSEVKWGVEQMEYIFGPDLGWTTLLKYMKLTDMGEELMSKAAPAEV